MLGSKSKDKRCARGRAEAIGVLSYHPYAHLMNVLQTENAGGSMDNGNLCVRQEMGGCYMHE